MNAKIMQKCSKYSYNIIEDHIIATEYFLAKNPTKQNNCFSNYDSLELGGKQSEAILNMEKVHDDENYEL